ncbi:MAG TPA: hypothetical protein VNL36_05710 [Bacteroidota bacterium]|nr:hypothetical protein [Bacteroidota bacterium]
MKRILSITFLPASLTALLLLNSCRSPLELTSQHRTAEVTIDGNAKEWEGKTVVLSNYNATLGIQHDDEFLYLCFTTSDRQVQFQILAMGMTVWFDPEGKEKHSFGVRFPLGMEAPARMLPRPGQADVDFLGIALQRQRPELELIGPGQEQTMRGTIGQFAGVNVRLGRHQDVLVYELKVPLKLSSQYRWSIEAVPTNPLSVGLEANPFAPDRLPAAQRQGLPTSGGGRGRGRAGGGSPQGPAEQPDPLKVWARVSLSPAENSK